MDICFVKSDQNISAIKKGCRRLKSEPHWQPDSVIIYGKDEPVFFEHKKVFDKYYAIRAVNLGGTTMCAVEILNEMFSTYTECAPISHSREHLPQSDEQSLHKLAQATTDRVYKHQKISQKQRDFLTLLLSGKKTKKQLVTMGLCSYDDIDDAYSAFMQELPWCYGFNNSVITKRAQSLNLGKLCFCYSKKAFADMHNISTELLEQVVFGVIRNQSILTPDEELFIVSAITYDDYHNTDSEQKIQKLTAIIKKINMFFSKYEEVFYKLRAQELNFFNITRVYDIKKYCFFQAIDWQKTVKALKKSGVKLDYRQGRRNRLKDFLE